MKLLLLLTLLFKESNHVETFVYVQSDIKKALLCNGIPHQSEKHPRREHGDARRHQALTDALLLPPSGVEVQDNYGQGEEENSLLRGCGIP